MKKQKEEKWKATSINAPAAHNYTKWYMLGLFVLTFLLYAQTTTFGLTSLDDTDITGNINSVLTDKHFYYKAFVTDAFFGNKDLFYRPLQNLTLVSDVKISGGINAWMFHFTNVFIFALIACALYLLFIRFTIPASIAFLAALLYCVHPLFVFSVVWIPARGDLLLTLFSILSMVSFIDFTVNNKYKHLLFTWICFTLALFSKETAAFLPFVYLFYFIAFQHDKIRISFKQLLLALLVLFTGVFWFWLRSTVITNVINKNIFSTHFFDILSNIQIIPTALSQLFLPFDFAPIPNFSFLKTILGVVITIFIAYLMQKKSSQPLKEKLFYIFWFLLFIIPPYSIKHNFIDYLDHRFLLPMIGIFLLLLSLFPQRWLSGTSIKNKGVLVGLIILFSLVSFAKSKSYRDIVSFCDATINNGGNAVVALNTRGTIKATNNDIVGAINDFNGAIAANDSYANSYYNRGCAELQMKDYNNAIADFTKEISLNKYAVDSYYYRGVLYVEKGDYVSSIKDLNNYISLPYTNYKSELSDAYYYEGKAYGVLGNHKKAVSCFTKAIESGRRNNEKAFFDRAREKFYLHDIMGTIADCDTVLSMNKEMIVAMQLKAQAQNMLQKK